jgi:hypothetical protein
MNVVLRLFGSVAVAAVIGAGGAAMATTTAHADMTTCKMVSGSMDTSPVFECGDGGNGLDPGAEQGFGSVEHPPGHPPRPPKCPAGQIVSPTDGKCFRPPAN